MTTIELKYDAFNIKTILTVNGTEKALRCFGTGKASCLREWIGDFFPDLIKSCNLGPGSECTVQFYGTQSDFEDVTNAYSEYQKQNEGVKIELPPYKRYPQSLTEIKEYADRKYAEYEAEIVIQKTELEKVNTALAEKASLEAEKVKTNLDELESKAAKAGEMLESVYQKELESLKADIAKIRLEAELLPFREEELLPYQEEESANPLEEKKPMLMLMSERYEKLLRPSLRIKNSMYVSKILDRERKLSIIVNTILNSDNYKEQTIVNTTLLIPDTYKEQTQEYQSEIEKLNLSKLETFLLKGFFSNKSNSMFNRWFNGGDLIRETIDTMFVECCKRILNYLDSFGETRENTFFEICDTYISCFSLLQNEMPVLQKKVCNTDYHLNSDEKKPWGESFSIDEKIISEILDASQAYINSVIDDVERYCTETLTAIKQHYETELKAAFIPITEEIAKRRTNLTANFDRYSATSEDKSTLERAIMWLEAKSECFVELAAEIDRIEEGSK